MPWVSNLGAIAAGVQAAIDKGVHQAATHIEDLATQLAPEDTGALKRSGHVEPERPDGSGLAKVVFGGGDVGYAAIVELGDPDNTNYPAQPYLTPAVREIDIGKEVGAQIRDLVARNRR